MIAQKNAVKKVFKNQGIKFRNFEILKKDEESLGIIFTYFMLETILLGNSKQEKLLSLGSIKKRCDQVRARGGKIVFTNGCFDILHAGHVNYLQAARNEAAALIDAIKD